jgi:Ni,Fe-hydrogenase I small subunit
MAGHGCIGCTEPAFWDTMAPLEKPLPDKSFNNREATIDNIGIALTGIAALGIAAHATATALRHKDEDQATKQEVKQHE